MVHIPSGSVRDASPRPDLCSCAPNRIWLAPVIIADRQIEQTGAGTNARENRTPVAAI